MLETILQNTIPMDMHSADRVLDPVPTTSYFSSAMDTGSTINTTVTSSLTIDEPTSKEVILIMFVLWGVVLPLVAGVGLIGNILTMVVLWRREMQSSTILYLRALVVTDTGILIGSVITLTPLSCANYLHGENLDYFKNWIYPVIHTPGYYLVMSLQECNVWITVSVAVERYIAICQPFRAARLITRRKTIIVIITITVISFVYNIPHLLASTAVDCKNASAADTLVHTTTVTMETQNNISSNSTTETYSPSCKQVWVTEFGHSMFYVRFRTIFYAAIIHVIPLLALLILNSFLIRELMFMKRRRSGTNIDDDNEANLSLVLVLIVIVFILCQTPGLISQFEIRPMETFHTWLTVSNLMFTTNSAVNFLIYTAFGRKFRKVLLRVFRSIYRRGSRLSNLSHRLTWQFNDFEMTIIGDNSNVGPSEMPTSYSNCDDKNFNVNNGECTPLNSTGHSTQKQTACENLVNGNQRINGV